VVTGLFVPLPVDVVDRLRRLALQERRRPRDQAAVLLIDVLNAADETEADRTPPSREPLPA
jgi:hypothetical protein